MLPFFFAWCLLFSGCEQPPEAHHFTGAIMGTFYNVKIAGPPTEDQAAAAEAAVLAALERVDRKMSTYKESSELSQFNAHRGVDPFPLSAETLQVFTIAQQVSVQSGGAFDVTIGPVVNAYGFGPKEVAQPPTPETLAALREVIGYEKLAVDPDAKTLAKQHPDMYCDLSAVAKGYGVDAAAEALDALGLTDYMVELGGEVRARGRNASGRSWQLAIEKPVAGERAIEMVIPLADLAMATSGDYRNFYEQDGKRISHTIDARTATPIAHRLASVTVLHDSCAWADAYATALNVLGPEEGMQLAERQGLAVFMIVHDGMDTFVEKQSKAFTDYLAEGKQ